MTPRRHPVSALACLAGLSALIGAGCASHAHRYFQPTAEQIGPETNSYGEAVIPRHGLIVVQGDEFAYGLARGRSRHVINGADEGQAAITISQALRKVIKGVTVENRGYPGDTVALSAARWADAPTPNLLILCYGYADLRAHTPLDVFSSGLKKIIKRAKARGAAVFVVTPPFLAGELARSSLEAYRSSAGSLAARVGAENFDASVAAARIKSPPLKTAAQRAAVYQAVAADMVPYIRVVERPPQAGQPGSADSRTVRDSAASAS